MYTHMNTHTQVCENSKTQSEGVQCASQCIRMCTYVWVFIVADYFHIFLGPDQSQDSNECMNTHIWYIYIFRPNYNTNAKHIRIGSFAEGDVIEKRLGRIYDGCQHEDVFDQQKKHQEAHIFMCV